MRREDKPKSSPPASRAPRSGLLLMGLVLIVMALVAVYANVQKARRDVIERVTIAPAPVVSPSPTAAATPPQP